MTKEDIAKVMDATITEIGFLREAGQKEYSHVDDNAFANFERVSGYLKIDRMKVLLVYALKHLDGITAAVNGHISQREPVEGRINDLIVYMILLKGMFIEEQGHARELTKQGETTILDTLDGRLAFPDAKIKHSLTRDDEEAVRAILLDRP